jgi:hypothetical protein
MLLRPGQDRVTWVCQPLLDIARSVQSRASVPLLGAACVFVASLVVSVVPGHVSSPALSSGPPVALRPATHRPSEITASHYFLQGQFAV